MSDDDTTPADPENEYTKLTTKVKRGTGTRDQDTTKVVTRHRDPTMAVRKHRAAVDLMQETIADTRDIQPEESDSED